MPQAGRHARDAGAGHDGALSSRVHPSRHRVPQRLERKGPDGRRGGAARALLVRAERRGRVDAARLHHRRPQEAGQDVRVRGGGADDDLLQPDGRHVSRLYDADHHPRHQGRKLRAGQKVDCLRVQPVRPHQGLLRHRTLCAAAAPTLGEEHRPLLAQHPRGDADGARAAARRRRRPCRPRQARHGGWRVRARLACRGGAIAARARRDLSLAHLRRPARRASGRRRARAEVSPRGACHRAVAKLHRRAVHDRGRGRAGAGRHGGGRELQVAPTRGGARHPRQVWRQGLRARHAKHHPRLRRPRAPSQGRRALRAWTPVWPHRPERNRQDHLAQPTRRQGHQRLPSGAAHMVHSTRGALRRRHRRAHLPQGQVAGQARRRR
mmetsp:Transcript_49698/g.166036  ORF Transcript_49698/g.166036 Transcript_49698/m.166036 type:complete len:380 (-) Transcript_49698:348-1487(-)